MPNATTAGSWTVFTHGGRNPACARAELDAIEWAREVCRRGAGEILLTSMDADGTKAGYDIALTGRQRGRHDSRHRQRRRGQPRSHGRTCCSEGKADAVLAASIFHFGEFTVSDVKVHLARHGIPVRL